MCSEAFICPLSLSWLKKTPLIPSHKLPALIELKFESDSCIFGIIRVVVIVIIPMMNLVSKKHPGYVLIVLPYTLNVKHRIHIHELAPLTTSTLPLEPDSYDRFQLDSPTPNCVLPWPNQDWILAPIALEPKLPRFSYSTPRIDTWLASTCSQQGRKIQWSYRCQILHEWL